MTKISIAPKAKRVHVPGPKSRAVAREVLQGSFVECKHCDQRIRFRAKPREMMVICNVYKGTKWNRVEHFHHSCYTAAGEPYGPAELGTDNRRQAALREAAARADQMASERN